MPRVAAMTAAADVPILEVAEALGLPLKKVGDASYTRCPNSACGDDEGDPHCQLGGAKNCGHCYKCGWAGGPVGLVMAVRGCGAREAHEWLRTTFGLKRGNCSGRQDTDGLTELARRRGWTTEALKALECMSENGTVIFPMFDAKGNKVGSKLRRADGGRFRVGEELVKSKTKRRSKHGLFYAKPLPGDGVVGFTEGEADTAAALSAGLEAVVGTAGAGVGRLAREAAQRLLGGRDVIMFPHGDPPGTKWLDEMGEALNNAQCRVRYVPADPKNDLDDRLKLGNGKPKAEILQELMDSAVEWRQQAHAVGQFLVDGTFIPRKLALTIAGAHALTFGYDPDTGAGRLMQYDNGVWRPAIDLDVICQQHLGDAVRRNRVAETLDALKREVPRRPWIEWNAERCLVNCLSGIIDPVTMKLGPHDPGLFSTFQIPVEFNTEVDTGLWDRFLEQVLFNDCQDLIRHVLGWLISASLKADKFTVWIGPENKGKTTLLEGFLEMLGERNWAHLPLQDLTDNRFAGAQLENKLAGCFDDIDSVPMKTASILSIWFCRLHNR